MLPSNKEPEPNSLKKGYCVYCDSSWTTADVTLPCPNGCIPPKPAGNSLLQNINNSLNNPEWAKAEIHQRPFIPYTPNEQPPPNAPDPASLWSFPLGTSFEEKIKEPARDALVKSIDKVMLDILKTPLQDQIGGTHYKKLKIQPVEYVHANDLGYFEGTAIKYLSRWKDKGGLEDLRKAIHFIELLISLEEQKQNGTK